MSSRLLSGLAFPLAIPSKFLPNPSSWAANVPSPTSTHVFSPSRFDLKLPFPPPPSPHPLFPSNHSRSILPLPSLPDNASPSPPSDFTTQASDAVSHFLQGFGVSEEESISIAYKSPRYIRMLIDEVRELDDTSMWVSWGSQLSGQEGEVGLREKLIFMAKEKGDDGKVAFLESIGLSLSSAMNVSRYLTAETLPGLIYKVKYMKELFFSGDDDGRLMGKKARRMMIHLSIPVDDSVQQTLSFFEKIEARRGGLDMLGSDDDSFRYLIESFPHLLMRSVESHVKPMVEFLQIVGIPRKCIKNIFLLFPPIIFSNIEVVQTRILALEEVGIVNDQIGKVLLKYPWILSKSIQENYKAILSFLLSKKVSKASVDRAIRSWPLLLGSSTSNLQSMVDVLSELDIRSKKLGQVIATSPQLLLQKPQDFWQVVSFFLDIGFEKETVGKIVARCPEIAATSIEKTLKRKLKFMAIIGVSRANLPRVIKKYPEFLVSYCEVTLNLRVKYLREIGLSKRDVASMVHRFSPILGYSIEEVLKPKVEFLVKTMNRAVRDVVDYPRFFSYSLEKRIKPRFMVLRGRNIECSLKDMLGKNDDEFAAEFTDSHQS